MARLRVEVDFELETDIWLNQECVGKSVRFSRDGYDIEVRLPPFKIDPASVTQDNLRVVDGYEGARYRVDKPSEFHIGTCKFRICIREDVEGIDQATFEGEATKEAKDLMTSHQRKCRKLAERAAIEFLDQLRHQGQTWLGSMGSISYSVHPQSSTFDEATEYRFKYSHADFKPAARPSDATLTSKTLGSVFDALAASRSVPLPEAFLADAEHFLGSGTQSDLQRAVLMAAIACELKVKEVLRTNVFPSGRALVATLISNPRDFSMSAAGLFDEAMKAAVGRSLREDNNELYRAIADNSRKDALFQNRNAIAHSGALIASEVAKENVRAARKVFSWLDELPVCNGLPPIKATET